MSAVRCVIVAHQPPDAPPPPKLPPPPEKPPPPPPPPPPPHRRRRRRRSTRRRRAAPMPPPTPPSSSITMNATIRATTRDQRSSRRRTTRPRRRRRRRPSSRRSRAEDAAQDAAERPERRRTARMSSISKSNAADARCGFARRLRGGSGSPLSDDRDDPVDARVDALRELVLRGTAARSSRAMIRRDGGVGQHAFEPVADLDAHLAVVLGDRSSAPLSWPLRPIFHASATRIEYASIGSGCVVGTISTASWLPVSRLPRGELRFERLPLRRRTACCVRSVTRARKRRDRQQARPCPLPTPARSASRRRPERARATSASRARMQRPLRPCVIAIASATAWSRRSTPRAARSAARRRRVGAPAPASWAPARRHGRCRGRRGGLPKSTFGGALIAASFSTVKLGFTSILNSIAVRLVGN